jgi:hypothetical protein
VQRDAIRTAPDAGTLHVCCPHSKNTAIVVIQKIRLMVVNSMELETGAAVERLQTNPWQRARLQAFESSRGGGIAWLT